MNQILLSTAYFAPVQYYSKFLKFDEVFIEQFENYNKQTFRNRCEILTANGIFSLVVPVVKGRGPKTPVKDIRISYDENWQVNHWRTIVSAYSSSPYFEYYADDLVGFFENEWEFLFQFNLEIHLKILEVMGIRSKFSLTVDFEKVPESTLNLREGITPKLHKAIIDPDFKAIPYTQVFSDKSWFVPNLSILDLLFNEGPNATTILEKSITGD